MTGELCAVYLYVYEGGVGRRRAVARDTKAINPTRDKGEDGKKWKREIRKLRLFPLVSLLVEPIMDHGTNKGPSRG